MLHMAWKLLKSANIDKKDKENSLTVYSKYSTIICLIISPTV